MCLPPVPTNSTPQNQRCTCEKLMLVAAMTALVAGCATPLSSAQKRDMNFYQSKGLVVEEKNPATAAGLGLLPGVGSF
jgi:type IV pilus biogenesis protein CpaD/CtpE